MLSIGAVAKASGESVKTLRFWTDQNLLLAELGENLYRYYPENVLERIHFIRSAQSLGFTLKEIRSILAIKDQDGLPCEHVRAQIEAHLCAVQQRIEHLKHLARDLQMRLDFAASHTEAACEGQGCIYLKDNMRISNKVKNLNYPKH